MRAHFVSISILALTSAGLSFADGPTVVEGSTACTLHLGWGHTGEAKLKRNVINGTNWIVQGCNIGQAGGGELASRGRFQRGPNGTWFALSEAQGVQLDANGGMMLFNVNSNLRPLRKDLKTLNAFLKKYYFIGFVRLTQWNHLELVDFAIQKLRQPESACKQVRVQFRCLAHEQGDKFMGQEQLKKRLATALAPFPMPADRPLDEADAHAFSVLNRFEALEDCFEDVIGSTKAYPESCGQEIVITPQSRISTRCVDWHSRISKEYPQWTSDYTFQPSLPESSSYPAEGPIY